MRANVFRAPGLYLRGIETETLPPLLTAVTGFVGVTKRGPLNVPQPLRNWGEFLEVFGGFVSYSYLAESAFGFFLNGGERCYVVRVADTKDRSSENIPGKCKRVDLLRKASNVESITDENHKETIRIKAINEGSWGNQIEIEVSCESGKDIDLNKLTESTESAGKVIKVGSVYDFSIGGRIWITHRNNPFIKKSFEIDSIDETNGSIALTSPVQELFPKDSIVSGRGFRLSFIYKGRRETFDNLSMNPENPNYFVDVINGDSGVTGYVERDKKGHSILGNVKHVRDGTTGRSRFKPKSRPNQYEPDHYKLDGGGDGSIYACNTLKDDPGNDSIHIIAKIKGREGNNVRVSASGFKTKTALSIPPEKDGAKNIVTVDDIKGFVDDDTLTIISSEDHISTEDVTIDSVKEEKNVLILNNNLTKNYPMGSEVKVQNRFNIIVKKDKRSPAIEEFYNLSMDSWSSRYFKNIINTESEYICVDEAGSNVNPPVKETQLAGGKDTGEIDYQYYTGYEDGGDYFDPPENEEKRPLGLSALEKVDDISLVAIPDLAWIVPDSKEDENSKENFVSAQQHLLFHCQKMGERFALLDPMRGMKLTDIVQWPLNFSTVKLSKFGALYYPWLFCTIEGEKRQVPPSGFIAGIIAQTDRKDGINKVPANMKIKGVVDLEAYIDQTAQDELNPRGINCIRKFEDGAIKLWGARTLSPELNWLYINVRRVFLSVIKTLSRNLLWAVFEPNDRSLWKRIESTLNTFFLTMVSKGMMASPRPEEAFYVKCNEETNTKEIVDAGQVIAEVGVALSAPAEFIVITVKKTPESLSIIEEEI